MTGLHAAVVAACAAGLLLLAVALPAAALAGAPAFRPAPPGADPAEPRRALLLLLLLLALHALAVKPRLPHNRWHEQHATGILLGVDAPLGFGGLEPMHGPAYAQAMKAARALTGGNISVFSLNYAVSLASTLAFFALILLLSDSGSHALVAAALLLFSPARMRLSTTESMFLLVELFSLLSLLAGALYARTGSRWPLAACALAALAAMNLRAELFVFFPLLLIAHGLILRRSLPRGPAPLVALAGVALLAAPRLAEILAEGDPRTGLFLPRGGDWILLREGPRALHVFFDPAYTPLAFPLLLAAGAVWLYARHRRLLACAALHAGWLVYFYSLHLTCVSLKVRTALGAQFVLVAVASCGARALLDRLGSAARRAGYAAVLFALCLLPWRYREFLGRLYTQQQEYLFLERAAAMLPSSALLVTLAEEDDPELLQNRVYQEELIAARAARDGKEVLALGVRRLLALREEVGFQDAFWYAGAPCVTVPWTRADTGNAMGRSPGFTHPLCRLMEKLFVLEPVLEGELDGPSLSWDAVEGGHRPVGLYRLAARRQHAEEASAAIAREPAQDPRAGPRPGRMSAPLRERLRSALAKLARGDLRGGFAEYRAIVRIAEPASAWPVEAYCRAWPRNCEPLLRAQRRQARLIEEGIRAFQRGDYLAAASRFDGVLDADPQDLDALLNRAAVAKQLREPEAARELYERVLRLEPPDQVLAASVLGYQADLLEEQGRRAEAADRLQEAVRLAPPDSESAARLGAQLERLRRAGAPR